MLNIKALQHEMIDHDCSTKQLAQICKISSSSLRRRLKGEVCFTLGEIFRCRDAFDLPKERVYEIFFAAET